MTTTFKTFALAAMMTVFATTAFANVDNKYNGRHNNQPVNTHGVMHRGGTNSHITQREYAAALNCKCKTCKGIVKAYKKQQKEFMKHGYCTCANCMKQNKLQARRGDAIIISGRR